MANPQRGRVVRLTSRGRGSRSAGNPPTGKFVRGAKLAALPVAYAGRRVAGTGKRVLGRTREEIDLEIQLRTAQHMFEVLGELKGCAQKLGQLLAIYEMALPPELAEPYRVALSRLQHSGPAMLAPLVHRAMAASMGDDWMRNFRTFDDRRPAAASVGQVHRATWRDGTPVAVKLMYPGAREAVLNDLAQLRRASAPLKVLAAGTDVGLVVDAVSECVRDELDYRREAENQRAFARAYADDADFVVPGVIHQQGDVLVSEWIDGVPVSRLVTSDSEVERNRIGRLMVRFVMTSFGRTGLLYGDPHPGNFLSLADGRLGVVDFGACPAFPPPGFLEMEAEFLEVGLNGGARELEDTMRRHGLVAEGCDFDAQPIVDAIEPLREMWISPDVRLSMSWLREQAFRVADVRLVNAARQLTAPTELAALGRTVGTLFGVLCQLEVGAPVREEFISRKPQLAEAIERFTRCNRQADQRPGGVIDIRRVNGRGSRRSSET
ncbi:MAG TPA: AarF/ABC1/UbiB kinase family protein [Mycobacterium sp.]|nr:AarF/ABC1/UbiB kinase family protein [Mycobacterium sp.]